ncbi:MAG: DUF2794 domain-containing protein [Beijerinckiaceae bacterium]|jgi:Protein of unknown function (DUF2794)
MSERRQGSTSVVTPLFPVRNSDSAPVVFTRLELNALLQSYGRGVAEGDWRDYALDFTKHAAVFSIFRRSAEAALFRIEKRPALANRQGAYAIVDQRGVTLRRGHELARVLLALRPMKRLK